MVGPYLEAMGRRGHIGWMGDWMYANVLGDTMTVRETDAVGRLKKGIRLILELKKELEGPQIGIQINDCRIRKPQRIGRHCRSTIKIEVMDCAEYGFRVHGTTEQLTVIG